jgi:hypothetical protein
MMRRLLRKYAKVLTALLLTVQVICLCCVFAACTTAGASSSPEAAGTDDPAGRNYSRWLYENYSSEVYTRADWIRDLLVSLDRRTESVLGGDIADIFAVAYDEGIIDSPDEQAYAALTRAYVADTIVKALGYEPKSVAHVTDVQKGDPLMTLAYYSYFLPDDQDKLYPEAVVTDEEYTGLLAELRCYASLHGKRVISFGDSIMFGMGNSGEGITDMIAQKYGMEYRDYSLSGATFGKVAGRSHIPNQVKKAVNLKDTADIILVNGGTNDMRKLPIGKMNEKFNIKNPDIKTFAGGMEYALALIGEAWPDVPVVYVRAHDTDCCDDKTERRFGEYSLKIAEHWGLQCVDIFSDTGFDAEKAAIRNRYTMISSDTKEGDSVHPTALGYAQYYLPAVSDMIENLLSKQVKR